jgi:Flp pilus assembly protein TadB
MFALDSPYVIPVVAIVAAFAYAAVAAIGRARVRELEIRERIAMIEHGMVPAPEADPNGFERRMRAVDRMQYQHTGSRFRTGGIMVMAVGLGLMILLWSVDAPGAGVGIGGFLVILGIGLLVSGAVSQPAAVPPLPHPRDDRTPPPPPGGVSI